MKHIKRYKNFKESIQIDMSMDYNFSDILESLSVFQDRLLDSINAQLVSFDSEFNFDLKDKSKNLDNLSKDSEFITSLQNKGYKISSVENTDDYETFISNTMKFVLIRKEDDSELNNPKYIIIQSKDESKNSFGELKLYKINDTIKRFYDTLSSKTIELKHKDKNYIYTTSNSGNEWLLQNIKDSNDIFKKYLRREDLRDILNTEDDIKIIII